MTGTSQNNNFTGLKIPIKKYKFRLYDCMYVVTYIHNTLLMSTFSVQPKRKEVQRYILPVFTKQGETNVQEIERARMIQNIR